jgi:hypothetical protein
MDLSYLKSRTAVNVEPAANFGGGWIITLEDGEMIRLGGDVAMEQVRPSPAPETGTLKYDELERALCNAYSYALNLAAGLIESEDPFQWIGWQRRSKNNPSDLAELLRESAKRFEARSRSYQNYCHDVAHASAAIATLLQMEGSEKYHELEENCSGFPGLWELSARAGRALTDVLYEVGDPNAEDHEFVDLCDTMEEHLLTEGKDLSYQDLVAFARKIVHSSEQSE